jgi:hypothetical protein
VKLHLFSQHFLSRIFYGSNWFFINNGPELFSLSCFTPPPLNSFMQNDLIKIGAECGTCKSNTSKYIHKNFVYGGWIIKWKFLSPIPPEAFSFFFIANAKFSLNEAGCQKVFNFHREFFVHCMLLFSFHVCRFHLYPR